MAYGTRARNEVRKNYIFKLLPLTQAAKIAGVKNIATARRWKLRLWKMVMIGIS